MLAFLRSGALRGALLFLSFALAGCGDGSTGDGPEPDGGMIPLPDAGLPRVDAGAPDEDAGAPPADLGPPAPGSISGTVRLGQAFTEDGIGNVIVEWGGGCPYEGSLDIHGLVVVPADFTAEDTVEYTIPDLAPGFYQVWGWFDDNGDTIPEVSMAAPVDDLANVPCAGVFLSEGRNERIHLTFDEIVNPL